MEIYLIRHTSVNCEQGTCYGASDIEVSNSFAEELRNVKSKLASENLEAFYSSPLQRCTILTKALTNREFEKDNRIKEINFGDWELQKWDSIDKIEYFHQWSQDFVNLRCPNGESFKDLYDRVNEFFAETLEKDHDKIGIITHGGVIRSILCHILKAPIEHSYSIGLDYGGITKINASKYSLKIEYVNK